MYKEYLVDETNTIRQIFDIFQSLSDKKMPTGIAVVHETKSKKVIGTITEGDLRRSLISGYKLNDKIKNIYQKNPILFNAKTSYKELIEKIPAELIARKRKSKKFLSKIVLIDEKGRLEKVLSYHDLWEQKVASHRHIVVLGLGYVGITLALVMADKGFYITGVDNDSLKISDLKSGNSYVKEKGIEFLLKKCINSSFNPQKSIPNDGDVFIISVGTPIKENINSNNFSPDLSYLEQISIDVGKKISVGNLVILRSTVPIGVTRNFVMPILEKYSGLKCGKDFYLSFAPERTAEGKAIQELTELPQIIGGINDESVEATAAIFRDITNTIVRVKSIEAAEMAKLINNSFRDLIFSYSNYTAKIASKYNLDIFEVISSANQGYPRDMVPYPSPGVGGPCLTKDPFIFSESISDGSKTLFEYGREINESMHEFVYKKVINETKRVGLEINNLKIFVCGMAFKGNPETGDIRNSSAVSVYNLFKVDSCKLCCHDPVANKNEMISLGLNPVEFEIGIQSCDVVVFLNNHVFYEKIDLDNIINKMNNHPIIFDGWNIFKFDNINNYNSITYMNLSKTISNIRN